MAEACIWRWTGIDGRILAQTLGCVRQFGVVASPGQLAGRILLLGWKSASEHCVISSRGHQRGRIDVAQPQRPIGQQPDLACSSDRLADKPFAAKKREAAPLA